MIQHFVQCLSAYQASVSLPQAQPLFWRKSPFMSLDVANPIVAGAERRIQSSGGLCIFVLKGSKQSLLVSTCRESDHYQEAGFQASLTCFIQVQGLVFDMPRRQRAAPSRTAACVRRLLP